MKFSTWVFWLSVSVGNGWAVCWFCNTTSHLPSHSGSPDMIVLAKYTLFPPKIETFSCNPSHFCPVYNLLPIWPSLMPKGRPGVTVTSFYNCKTNQDFSPKNLLSWRKRQQQIHLNATSLEKSFTNCHCWYLLLLYSFVLFQRFSSVFVSILWASQACLQCAIFFLWCTLVIIYFNSLQLNTSKIIYPLIFVTVPYPAKGSQTTERKPLFLFTLFPSSL